MFDMMHFPLLPGYGLITLGLVCETAVSGGVGVTSQRTCVWCELSLFLRGSLQQQHSRVGEELTEEMELKSCSEAQSTVRDLLLHLASDFQTYNCHIKCRDKVRATYLIDRTWFNFVMSDIIIWRHLMSVNKKSCHVEKWPRCIDVKQKKSHSVLPWCPAKIDHCKRITEDCECWETSLLLES